MLKGENDATISARTGGNIERALHTGQGNPDHLEKLGTREKIRSKKTWTEEAAESTRRQREL